MTAMKCVLKDILDNLPFEENIKDTLCEHFSPISQYHGITFFCYCEECLVKNICNSIDKVEKPYRIFDGWERIERNGYI